MKKSSNKGAGGAGAPAGFVFAPPLGLAPVLPRTPWICAPGFDGAAPKPGVRETGRKGGADSRRFGAEARKRCHT